MGYTRESLLLLSRLVALLATRVALGVGASPRASPASPLALPGPRRRGDDSGEAGGVRGGVRGGGLGPGRGALCRMFVANARKWVCRVLLSVPAEESQTGGAGLVAVPPGWTVRDGHAALATGPPLLV